MYRPRRGRGLPRGRALGLLMLGAEVMRIGVEHIPAITLGLLAVNSFLFVGDSVLPELNLPSSRDICMQPAQVWVSPVISLAASGDVSTVPGRVVSCRHLGVFSWQRHTLVL